MDDMIHSFNTDVADEVGLSAAIVLHHIVYWCKRNEEAGKNFREGRYWMFSPQVEIAKAVPYLSLITVKRALSALFQAGLIHVGKFNRVSFDNTSWYAPSEKALALYANCDVPQNHNETVRPSQKATDNTKVKQESLLPPIVPQEDKPKPTPAPKPPKKDYDYRLFDIFWQAYPRKTAKDAARKAWVKLNPNEKLFEKIMDGLNRSVQFDRGFRDPQYTPHPATWLNGKRWEDKFELPNPTTAPPRNRAFDELKEMMKEPGVPPPPLPPELQNELRR